MARSAIDQLLALAARHDDVVGDDQVMLGLDGGLDIVADDAAATPAGGMARTWGSVSEIWPSSEAATCVSIARGIRICSRRRSTFSGRIIGPKPPFKPKHIWGIRQQLKANGRVRDLAMFNCAIDAKLRGCDLVKLRVSDVAPGGARRARATIIQQKTGQPVSFQITEPTRDALAVWLKVRGRRNDDWLFPSRSRPGDHVSTRQYARLVDKWVSMIELEPQAYGTHSLRRTKVALIYKKTGNLRACQLLLGHRKLESTVRYLGIEVDDALEMSEQIDL